MEQLRKPKRVWGAILKEGEGERGLEKRNVFFKNLNCTRDSENLRCMQVNIKMERDAT